MIGLGLSVRSGRAGNLRNGEIHIFQANDL